MSKFNEKSLIFQPDIISSGSFGTVYHAKDYSDGSEYAVKIISKRNIGMNRMRMLRDENEISLEVDHPNLAKTYYITQDDDAIRIYMDYYSGGNVHDYVESYNSINECNTYVIFSQLCKAVRYLHLEKNIVHRDIKLENMFIRNKRDLSVVLGDFGFSRHRYYEDPLFKDFPGSLFFSAPEMVRGIPNEGYPADIWAMGICLFVLVAGEYPFDFMTNNFAAISDEPNLKLIQNPKLRNLISQMLTMNPKDRYDIQTVLKHPWMTEWNDLIRSGLICPPNRVSTPNRSDSSSSSNYNESKAPKTPTRKNTPRY